MLIDESVVRALAVPRCMKRDTRQVKRTDIFLAFSSFHGGLRAQSAGRCAIFCSDRALRRLREVTHLER